MIGTVSLKTVETKFKKTSGKITVIFFDPNTKKRVLTHDGLNLLTALAEIADHCNRRGQICKIYYDLPNGRGYGLERDFNDYLTDKYIPHELDKYTLVEF